jgi:hypothetical protein
MEKDLYPNYNIIADPAMESKFSFSGEFVFFLNSASASQSTKKII